MARRTVLRSPGDPFCLSWWSPQQLRRPAVEQTRAGIRHLNRRMPALPDGEPYFPTPRAGAASDDRSGDEVHMTNGSPAARPLRLAATAVHLVEFFFRRADRSGDIYPGDAPYGRVAGADPDRIMVIGERGEISLGVVTHELSIAGYIAREHRQNTGRGCAWSVATLPDDHIDDGPALVGTYAVDVAKTDLVIVLAGISDCLTLTSAARWHRGLDAMLAALFDHLPLDAHVAVAEIPPLGNAGSLSRAARLAAGYRSTLLNHRTRKLVQIYPRATVVPFPLDLTDRLWVPQSEQERYTRTYALWSRSLMAACLEARHLGAPASRHSAERRPGNGAPLP